MSIIIDCNWTLDVINNDKQDGILYSNTTEGIATSPSKFKDKIHLSIWILDWIFV